MRQHTVYQMGSTENPDTQSDIRISILRWIDMYGIRFHDITQDAIEINIYELFSFSNFGQCLTMNSRSHEKRGKGKQKQHKYKC